MCDTLGVDLGTSAIKVARFDARGEMVGCVSRSYRRVQEHEVPFERVWTALADGTRELITLTPDRPDVAGIGLASQTNSFALVSPDNEPLTHVHLWTGNLAVNQAKSLNKRLGTSRIARATGISALTGQLVATKLHYLQQRGLDFPETQASVWLLPDIVTQRLCGQAFTDPSLWSLTGLYDLESHGWWPPMLEALDLAAARLPHLSVAGASAGRLLPETARQLLLPDDIPVAVGALDHLAGAIGVGNLGPGGASLSTGTTSCVVVTHADRPAPKAGGVVGRHPGDPALWYALTWSGLSSTGLNWCAGEYGGGRSLADLLEEAGHAPADAEEWQAHPREPDNGDAGFDFTHLRPATGTRPTGAQAMRAVLECITKVIQDLLGRAAQGCRIRRLTVIGGGARSDVWMQLLADRLNMTIVRPACIEASARGAALLAGLAAGLIPSLSARPAEITRTFVPRQAVEE